VIWFPQEYINLRLKNKYVVAPENIVSHILHRLPKSIDSLLSPKEFKKENPNEQEVSTGFILGEIEILEKRRELYELEELQESYVNVISL